MPVERLIAQLLWETPLPRPTVSVSLSLGRDEILLARPAPAAHLPVAEVRLGALLHALSPMGVVRIFAAGTHAKALTSGSRCSL